MRAAVRCWVQQVESLVEDLGKSLEVEEVRCLEMGQEKTFRRTWHDTEDIRQKVEQEICKGSVVIRGSQRLFFETSACKQLAISSSQDVLESAFSLPNAGKDRRGVPDEQLSSALLCFIKCSLTFN